MLWWMAQTSVTVAVLAALAAIAGHVFRLSPAVRHALWLLVLLKFLTPPLVEWRVPVPGLSRSVAAPFDNILPEPAPASELSIAQGSIEKKPDAAIQRASMPQVIVASQPNESPTSRPVSHGDAAPKVVKTAPWLAMTAIGSIVFYVWMGGAAVAALVVVLRVRRFQRLLMWRLPAPDWLRQHVADLSALLRVWPPLTHLLPGIRAPFLWCVGRPELLLPVALMDRLDVEARRSVIAHELAHLRRRDHWVRWLELMAFLIWWWNPLFWIVRRRLRDNAEMACDAWVVNTLPSCRRAYAETLIEVSRCVSQWAEPMPVLGMASNGRRAFEGRLTMIMRHGGSCRVSVGGMAAIGLFALLILPAWSPAQKDDSKPDDKPSATRESAREVELKDALKQAKCDGKYAMLLRQFSVADDAETYGDFRDFGTYSGNTYAGHDDLPPGFWVYVAPYWYIWRDETAQPKNARSWGPEQATGAPNTDEAGDRPTAWASRTQDEQDEWLLLEYAQLMTPTEVHVHATYNPGAITRVTAFRLDGTEVEIWKGQDPTSVEEDSGVSKLRVKDGFNTNRIKVYIASKEVPGWNEIDAVGLVEKDGKPQWAVAADASSTYAQLQPVVNNRRMSSGKRAWGPEQVIGPPDTPEAGDFQTAWASLTEDGQEEWLQLDYAVELSPIAVLVHETYNPGALIKISAFRPDGSEVEVWKGKDPTAPGSGKGVSVVPLEIDFKTKRVKLYFDSKETPGWNEIDAVGLRDEAGKVHWATAADASTTYARQANDFILSDGLSIIEPQPTEQMQRLMNLEKENLELKKQIEKLKAETDKRQLLLEKLMNESKKK